MSLTHSANNNCLFCVLTRPITYQHKLLLLYSCVLLNNQSCKHMCGHSPIKFFGLPAFWSHGSRIPSGACQPKFKVARSLRKCVFCDKFEIVGLMVFPSELRQPTCRLPFPIFNVIHISEKELRREKNVGAFNLGACEVARSLQARLTGLHGF